MILLLLACSAPQGLDEAALAEAVSFGEGVDGAQMMQDVEELVAARATEAPTSDERHGDLPYYRLAARDWLMAELSDMGHSVVEANSSFAEGDILNFYVEVPGSARPEELVLLTGHYDCFYAGADDNGSAISVMLQAARLLLDATPERTVRLVFFDREEQDLLGSRDYFAARADEDVVAIVNMDGVGFAGSEPGSQSAPTGLMLPDTGDFLGAIANGSAAPHTFIGQQIAERQGFKFAALVSREDQDNAMAMQFHRSDHSPAWTAGLPALFLTDTANFRNANYHTETDTPDTLNPSFLEGSGRLIVALTLGLANQE